jgi:hypothetical protein
MPIDFKNDDVFILEEAGERYKISPQTLHRWVSVGYRGVKLEHAKIGRRIYIFSRSIQKFSDAIMAAEGRPPRVEKPSPSVRARQIARAKAKAEELGLS